MTFDEIKEQIRALSTEEKRHLLRFLEREIEDARFEEKFCGGPDEMIVDGKYFDVTANGGKDAWVPTAKRNVGGKN